MMMMMNEGSSSCSFEVQTGFLLMLMLFELISSSKLCKAAPALS